MCAASIVEPQNKNYILLTRNAFLSHVFSVNEWMRVSLLLLWFPFFVWPNLVRFMLCIDVNMLRVHYLEVPSCTCLSGWKFNLVLCIRTNVWSSSTKLFFLFVWIHHTSIGVRCVGTKYMSSYCRIPNVCRSFQQLYIDAFSSLWNN